MKKITSQIQHYNYPEWIQRWIGPFIIAVATIVGLIWSWGTWPDVQIDFGRELYVPWRLTEGDVLYRDIKWYYGPLYPYTQALWFLCFGVSLQSLIIFNICIIAGVLWLLYQIFLHIAGRIPATLSCLTFLGLFAFAQFVSIGNYNWVCPYSHGMTHGVALSLLSLYLLLNFARSCRYVWIGSSGFVLGLVFLTKTEIFLAVLIGSIAGIAALFWLRRSGWKSLLMTLLIWVTFIILPILICFILLSFEMPPGDSLYATMGMLPHMLNTESTLNLFSKWSLGTSNTLESVIIILKWIGWYALVFLPACGLSFFFNRTKVPLWRISVLTFLLVGSTLLLLRQLEIIHWYNFPRPWQVFMLFLGLVMFWKIFFRRNYDCQEYPAVVLRFAMVAFSFVLLAKIIFFVRIGHYGFGLAMPATLMVIVALWEWIPQIIRKFGGQPIVFRSVVLAAWLIVIAAHIALSDRFFSEKKYVVASGSDSFRSGARGVFFNTALQSLSEQASPGDTMTVLPEGIMLNYQLRMKSPTPYIAYLPGVLLHYGEEKILESFQKKPPDWIVLIHRDASEFGARFFSRDYGQLMASWIIDNYTFKIRIGAVPFNSNYFGVLIGEKKS